MSRLVNYRSDIDGLRAVAILSVIMFHAFPDYFRGGYVGVDVFFVISGYLITGVILRGLDKGDFNFFDFYSNRIKRIFPSLILVIFCSLALGWLFLLESEYRNLGEYTVAGSLFFSNIVLLREIGYFDEAAELKPLLHLWSLAIEEQFYIVWPLFVYFVFRWRWNFLLLSVLLFGCSFVFNVMEVREHPNFTFYLPPARFWELLFGSILACTSGAEKNTFYDLCVFIKKPGKRICFFGINDASSFVGVLLIITAVVSLTKADAFPGWLALLPTCGAFLIIGAGSEAWINRKILSSRLFVFIGLISYPLYLWHWPLLSFVKITAFGETSPAMTIAIMELSVCLSWLTYYYIERPIRVGKKTSLEGSSAATLRQLVPVRLVPAALAAGMMGLVIVGVYVNIGVFAGRLSDFYYISNAKNDWGYFGNTELPGRSKTDKVMFIGDSYIEQYFPRMEKISRENRGTSRAMIFRTAPGCAPVPGIERKSQKCNDFVVDGFARADGNDVRTVIIGGSWVGFVKRGDYYDLRDPQKKPLDILAPENEWIFWNLQNVIKEFVRNQKDVYLVFSHPGGIEADPSSMIDRIHAVLRTHAGINRSAYLHSRQAIDEKLRKVAINSGASIIDPVDWLCNEKICPTASPEGVPFYKDRTHLRASYVRDHVRFFDRLVLE